MISKTTGKTLALFVLAMLTFAVPAAAHPTIDVVASNWKFTPSTITVDAGQTATLRLTSTAGTHGIASDELGIASTMITQGRFVEVSFTPHQPGTYVVHCSVYCGAGHPNMALTVVVNAATAATAAPVAPPAPPAPVATPVPTPTPKPARTPTPLVDDRHFIILMVHHERMGLEMAQLAVKDAHHSDIRTFAKGIVSRTTTAIAQLQHWYKVWYGSSVPAVPPMSAMPSASTMQSMSAQPMMQMDMAMMRSMSPQALGAAPDFDRAFMIGDIHHESMGASISLAAEQGLAHPELRRFARSAASTQMNDVALLWHWYAKWYPQT